MDFRDIPDFPRPEYQVKMPPLNHLDPQKRLKPQKETQEDNSEIDEEDSEEPDRPLNEEEKAIMEPVTDHLQDASYIWDLKKAPADILELPPTQFGDEEWKEICRIQVPTLLEQCQRRPLNSLQLQNIWQNGTFEVVSSHSNIKHVWKVAHFLTSGIQRLKEIWFNSVSLCACLLLKVPHFWKCPPKGHAFRLNIWAAFRHILIFFVSLFHLIFGVPLYLFRTSVDKLMHDELQKERTARFARGEFPDTLGLVKYLVEPKSDIERSDKQPKNKKERTEAQRVFEELKKSIQKNKESLAKLQADINAKWKEFYDAQVAQIADVDEEEFNSKVAALQALKWPKEMEFLSQNNLVPAAIRAKLCAQGKAIFIFQDEQNRKEFAFKKEETRVESELCAANPIRSRVAFWFSENRQNLMAPISARMEEEFEQNVLVRLQNAGLAGLAQLWGASLALSRDFKEREAEVYRTKILSQRDTAEDREINYPLAPPYEVTQYKDSDNQTRYTFTKSRTITVRSNFFGFRVVVDLYRLFYWSKSLTLFSLRYALLGKFGLKGLLWWRSYYTDYSINHKTGVVNCDQDKVEPLLVTFSRVLKGISESRNNFEQSPDTGFFGKNMARVFNLFECYVLRFVLVGLIGVLVIHPLLNVGVICFLLVISFTSVLWVAVSILANRVWGILIFNYLKSFQYSWVPDDRMTCSLDRLVKYHHILPLLALLINLFRKALVPLVVVLFLTILNPFLSLLWLFVSVFIVCSKYLWDLIVFYIIVRCLAKVPQKDTNLARRIAGPGISRNLYFSLSMEDSVILIQALLEKIQLENWEQQVTKLIRYPASKLRSLFGRLMKSVCDNLSGTPKGVSAIEKSNDSLVQRVNKKLKERRKLIPRMPSLGVKVKFSDSEVQILKRICEEMIRGKLKRLQIEDFVWKRTGVPKGKYKMLVTEIIRTAFETRDIFETVEKMDERIVLEEEKDFGRQKREMVKQILDGNDLLERFNPVVRPLQEVEEIPSNDSGFSEAVYSVEGTLLKSGKRGHLTFLWRFDEADVPNGRNMVSRQD